MTNLKRPRRATAKRGKTMVDYAMPLYRLDLWLRNRGQSTIHRRPVATSLSMLDGFVAAVVAGPVSLDPPDWICPLLGVEPDAFNHDNEEFSAIAATAVCHNTISDTLSTSPEDFEPLFIRANGDVDAKPWCRGFYAAMKLRLLAWSKLLDPNVVDHALLLPILFYCVDNAGCPLLHSNDNPPSPAFVREAWRDIPLVVEAMRQYWMPTRYARAS